MEPVSVRIVIDKVFRASDRFSVRGELAKVTDLPPAFSVRQRLAILQAIYRFSPEVRLHPNDSYRPTSVPWYLDRVRMRRRRAWWPDVHVLHPFEVTVQSLISQVSGGQHSGRGRNKTDFFLETVINKSETRAGLLAIAPCYVHLRRDPDSQGWDIQYWFFYAYNGDITTGADFEHEGDFEHVTVRLSESLEIRRVFYHVHNNESQWRELGEFLLTAEGRPVVYSALDTHATYWSRGKHVRDWLPDDYTADGGPIWRTWNRLQLVGNLESPLLGQEWIKYTGQWGEIGSKISWLSGPYGPAFQRYWDRDT